MAREVIYDLSIRIRTVRIAKGIYKELFTVRKLLACENIRFSSLFVAGDVRDVPPRETSPAAKSEEKRMFSQASKLHFISGT